MWPGQRRGHGHAEGPGQCQSPPDSGRGVRRHWGAQRPGGSKPLCPLAPMGLSPGAQWGRGSHCWTPAGWWRWQWEDVASGAGGSRCPDPTAAPLRKPKGWHSRGVPAYAGTLGVSCPPASRPSEAGPPADASTRGTALGTVSFGLCSPAARAQPGTLPGHQLQVLGTPIPAVPGSGPGLALGGTMVVPPVAPLTSSRLFPSLLCTRHAPCEPFLRGIRTKGSWEYLSGTGERGILLGGPSCPRAGHRCCGIVMGIAPWALAVAGVTVVVSVSWCC